MRRETAHFFVGLDLGQKRDFSALAVVQRGPGSSPAYELRHLERFPLNTPYPRVVARAREILATLKFWGNASLVMDATGVGASVLDLFHAQGVRPIAITITAGHSAAGTNFDLRVPKGALIATLVALFGEGRLRIAAGMPYAPELIEELLNLRVKINPRTRKASYGAKGTQKHDDLVLSLALALAYAEKEHAFGQGSKSA